MPAQKAINLVGKILKIGLLDSLNYATKSGLTKLLLSFAFITDFFITHFFLSDLSCQIKNKSVYITGSAPAGTKDTDYDVLVAVSGALGVLHHLHKAICDIWVVDASLFNRSHVELCMSKQRALDIGLQYVHDDLTICSIASNQSIPEYNKGFPFKKAKSIVHFPRWLRQYIVNRVCGTCFLDNLNPSESPLTQVGTGAWTICLMAYFNPKSIHFTGLSLKSAKPNGYTTYWYDKEGNETDYLYRNHATPDVSAISSCFLRHYHKISFSTNSLEFISCIQPNKT